MTDTRICRTKDESPSLEEAQQFVGGLVELVRLEGGHQMLVNEEGLLHQLPMNEIASFQALQDIFGNAIILKDEAKWD